MEKLKATEHDPTLEAALEEAKVKLHEHHSMHSMLRLACHGMHANWDHSRRVLRHGDRLAFMMTWPCRCNHHTRPQERPATITGQETSSSRACCVT
jgi:hypothetical protein